VSLARLLTRLLRLCRRILSHAAKGPTMTTPQQTPGPDDRMSVPPLPGEAEMSPEQTRALERVRAIYHTGSQPLTVARARYDLIRRGVFDQ
jgi:hypothetical protein